MNDWTIGGVGGGNPAPGDRPFIISHQSSVITRITLPTTAVQTEWTQTKWSNTGIPGIPGIKYKIVKKIPTGDS
jgi:hypothetical protein